MAEIKSTMEKVMERVAAMGPIARDEVTGDDIVKEGMRLAADYMRGDVQELAAAVAGRQESSQQLLRTGMARSLLRNIILPRDDNGQMAERTMQGLLQLGGGSRDLIELLSDIKEILERYRQHKKQLRQQLESALRQQLEMALAQQGIKNDRTVTIDPRMHPKYQEEWQRVKSELDEQYGQALEERKEAISQLLGA
jgi:hypothetical protein